MIKLIYKTIKEEVTVPIDILPDDTIEFIKYKIALHFKCQLHEVYLFSKQKRTLHPKQIYHDLLQFESFISETHLLNFLSTIYIEPPSFEKKPKYEYDDLLQFQFTDIHQDIAIGVSMVQLNTDQWHASVNPYSGVDTSIYDTLHIQSFHKRLLLEYMPFVENIVYICLKKDIASSIYFPDIPIQNLQPKLDMFSKIEESIQLKPSYSHGITSITCSLEPLYPVSVPLESMFKLLHVSVNIPMIQYNTGKEETILYRLYTEEIDLHGNKIPTLKKNEILKRNQSYKNSVTLLCQDKFKFGFMENGSIMFDYSGERTKLSDIENYVRQHINPVLVSIQTFMQESGFSYPMFDTFTPSDSRLVRIHNIIYNFTFEGNASPTKNSSCTQVFFVDMESSQSQYEKRYKRVSNFNEQQLADEICTINYLKGKKPEETLHNLRSLHYSDKDANAIIKNFYEQNLEKIKVDERIGFPTIIEFRPMETAISMSGIQNIYYLSSIEQSLSMYISILQGPLLTCGTIETTTYVPEVFVPKTQIQFDDSESEDEHSVNEKDPEFLDIDEINEELSTSVLTSELPEVEWDEPKDEEIPEIEVEWEGGAKTAKVEHDVNLRINHDHFALSRLKRIVGNDLEESYSKRCPTKKLPIVITPKEKDALGKEWKTIPYKDKFHVMCPKYWSVTEQKPISDTEKKSRSGWKGKIIDIVDLKQKKQSVIQPQEDGDLYMFGDTYSNPGFVQGYDGLVPCCYTLEQTEKELPEVKPAPKEQKESYFITDPKNQIKKYGKYGYIPVPLRNFFKLSNECAFLEEGKKLYLLRYSIAPKDESLLNDVLSNSFIACIAYIYETMFKTTFSIREMKQYLLEKVNDVTFTQFQNGTFINQFGTIEAFKSYILESTPDYTYLWDIVCSPCKLNKDGINLVIFRVIDERLELICPSNHYSAPFNPNCRTLFLLENSKGMEPLVVYNQDPLQFVPLHTLNNKLKSIKDGLLYIKNLYAQCKPTSDTHFPNTDIPIHSNLTASEISQLVQPTAQVVRNKMCVGLIKQVFIPCYPSPVLQLPIEDIPIHDYVVTKKELTKWTGVPCKPLFRVIDHGTIIGILTESNYFVPCHPIPNKHDNLHEIDLHISNEYKETTNTKDQERIDYTRKLKLERQLYAKCRSYLTRLLNSNTYYTQRQYIKHQLSNSSIDTITSTIEDLLKDIPLVDNVSPTMIETLHDSTFLFIPRFNLVTEKPNDYFKRLADEMIRYKRLSTFMFKSQVFTYDLPYQVNNTELILLGSIVGPYLDELLPPAPRSKLDYDNANINIHSYAKLFKVVKLDLIRIVQMDVLKLNKITIS
jgi:hypothetical protein